MKNWMVAVSVSLSVGMFACAVDPAEEEAASASEDALDSRPPTTTGVTNGGGCKINSGTNSGSTGTYDTSSDPGHVWCCTGANGSGSCTECTASGGGACTATLTKPPVKRPIYGGTIGGTFTLAP